MVITGKAAKKQMEKWGCFFICVYAITSIYILAASCYIFPALSRFDMNVGWFVKMRTLYE